MARRRRLLALVALAVAGVVLGIVFSSGGGDNKPKRPKQAKPTILLLTQVGLRSYVKSHHRTVYWAGPRQGVDYQLSLAPDGRVFLLYVPAGSPAQPGKVYLSVGTYPFKNAFAVTAARARQKGFVGVKVGNVTTAAVYAKARPANVFVGFQGSPYQVEVFDPKPAQARRLVAAGRIVPVP